jgi:hypothetical protein
MPPATRAQALAKLSCSDVLIAAAPDFTLPTRNSALSLGLEALTVD